MAYIFRRGKYLWIGYYINNQLIRESLKLVDTKQNRIIAHQIRLQKELEISKKIFSIKTNNILFSDAVYYFMQHKKLLDERKSLYWSATKKFSAYLQDDPLIKDISIKDLIAFADYLKVENKSDVTIANYINHLNTLFDWCKKENYIDKEIRLKIKTSRKEPRIIPDNHLHKLLWYLRVHNTNQYNLIKFLSLTGFRKSEALNLKWNDIDYDRNSIYVTNTKAKRIDMFPLYDRLKIFLSKIEKRNEKIFSHSKEGLDFYKRALKRLKLPSYSIHDLRRKFGTSMAEKGLTPYELQKLMRHRNIQTTMQYYVNISLQSIAKKM